jgi:hypothetical protein
MRGLKEAGVQTRHLSEREPCGPTKHELAPDDTWVVLADRDTSG